MASPVNVTTEPLEMHSVALCGRLNRTCVSTPRWSVLLLPGDAVTADDECSAAAATTAAVLHTVAARGQSEELLSLCFCFLERPRPSGKLVGAEQCGNIVTNVLLVLVLLVLL